VISEELLPEWSSQYLIYYIKSYIND